MKVLLPLFLIVVMFVVTVVVARVIVRNARRGAERDVAREVAEMRVPDSPVDLEETEWDSHIRFWRDQKDEGMVARYQMLRDAELAERARRRREGAS